MKSMWKKICLFDELTISVVETKISETAFPDAKTEPISSQVGSAHFRFEVAFCEEFGSVFSVT